MISLFLNLSSTSTLLTFHLHKLYGFTFLNLSSAFTLPLPTWFSYKFILLHFHISPLFLPSCSLQKRSILSLSLQFSILMLFFFQPLFSPNSSFCYCWFNCTSHLFCFWQICINFYAYLGILVFQFPIKKKKKSFFLSDSIRC